MKNVTPPIVASIPRFTGIVLGLLGAVSSVQAATIIDFRTDDVDRAGTVSVTANPQEITNPFIDGSPNSTRSSIGVGDTWGGAGANPLLIDGVTVGFTINQVTDYAGVSVGTPDDDFYFRGSGNGLGINSFVGQDSANGNNGNWFEMDGDESMTWTASTSIQWEGFFTSSWGTNTNSSRALTFSSDSWKGLTGVVTGTGVTYDSVAGSFEVRNVAGNVNLDGAVTLEDLVGGTGPTLDFTTMTISNSGTQGSNVQTMTFAAVPEPGTYALLAGCFGLAAVMVRRRV